MTTFQGGEGLEAQIAQWRAFLRRRQAIHGSDVEELETHLRDQVAALVETGLAEDEAFLVAVKRMGSLDAVSRELARDHSERLWKQLVVAPDDPGNADATVRIEGIVVLCFAVAAGIAIKLPALLGQPFVVDDEPNVFYPRNATFFVLPLLAGYFAWKRAFHLPRAAWLAVPFAMAAVVANVYPFTGGSDTGSLMILHLPIALWLVVGVAYVGGRWWAGSGRMNFVRFSGELFIYYVLIAMGGGVLIGFTLMMFAAIDVDADWLAQSWMIPCGAAGAVMVGSGLVEAKQSVIENMAPVLSACSPPCSPCCCSRSWARWRGPATPLTCSARCSSHSTCCWWSARASSSTQCRRVSPTPRPPRSIDYSCCWSSAHSSSMRWRWRPSPGASPSSASRPTVWPRSART